MMKCRGCGKDNAVQGEEVEGLGFMHDKCEIRRLRSMNSELEMALATATAERDFCDTQLVVLSDGVNRRCGADANQLPLVSLDRLTARLAEAEALLRAVVNMMVYEGCFSATMSPEWFKAALKVSEAAKGGRDE